jgi:hypothetical protein
MSSRRYGMKRHMPTSGDCTSDYRDKILVSEYCRSGVCYKIERVVNGLPIHLAKQ